MPGVKLLLRGEVVFGGLLILAGVTTFDPWSRDLEWSPIFFFLGGWLILLQGAGRLVGSWVTSQPPRVWPPERWVFRGLGASRSALLVVLIACILLLVAASSDGGEFGWSYFAAIGIASFALYACPLWILLNAGTLLASQRSENNGPAARRTIRLSFDATLLLGWLVLFFGGRH